MAEYRLGKKGMFMTLIAIFVIVAFITIFTPSDLEISTDLRASETRITQINEYVSDLENVYFERALQASSTKAILALTAYMEAQSTFLTDFEDSFEDVLLNSSINGVAIDSFISPSIMSGNNFNDLLAEVKDAADDLYNLESSFVVNSATAYQERPWMLNVDANVSFTIVSETAIWNRNLLVQTEVDIQYFEDPYYLVHTQGNYSKKFNRSSIQINEWELQDVKDHIAHGTYFHVDNSKAPNFIMRFTNTSLNSSCCGIESIVNPDLLDNPDQTESYADYLFFNHTFGNQCTDLYNVSSLVPDYTDIKLEFEHLVLYNLSSLDTESAC